MMKKKMRMCLVLATIFLMSSFSFAGSAQLEEIFGSNFHKVIGPATDEYNCLAYSLGVTDEWIWPWGTLDAGLADVDNYLGNYMYERTYTHSDANKIVAYYNPNSSLVGHFGKIITNGRTWDWGITRAKLGENELVETSKHECYVTMYGNIAAKYK